VPLPETAKTTIYVVDYPVERFDEIFRSATEVLDEGDPLTAGTLVGVAALWQPDVLIEIDAMIVADSGDRHGGGGCER